jgi:hypothetical protein
MFSVLAIGSKASGFKPGQRRWIFTGDKNLQQEFLKRASKSVDSVS